MKLKTQNQIWHEDFMTDLSNFNKKLKNGISPQQIENFAKKHTQQVFSNLSIFIAFISCSFDFFSGAGLSILFTSVGAILGIGFASKIEMQIRKGYIFIINQEKNVEMLLGGVKIVIALFLPFIFFGFLGLLSGISYHFYIREAQSRIANQINEEP